MTVIPIMTGIAGLPRPAATRTILHRTQYCRHSSVLRKSSTSPASSSSSMPSWSSAFASTWTPSRLADDSSRASSTWSPVARRRQWRHAGDTCRCADEPARRRTGDLLYGSAAGTNSPARCVDTTASCWSLQATSRHPQCPTDVRSVLSVHHTIRYDTVDLRALKSWRDGQLNLAHGWFFKT